jgi:GNAT superfamily N-acetyltransferase
MEVAVPEHRIWRLREDEAAMAGAVLGRAFVDEPIFVASLPGRHDRERLCPPLFTANVRHACRFGEAWAIGPRDGELVGVAYWVQRPEPELSAAEAAELGYAVIDERWGWALQRIGAHEAEAAGTLTHLAEPWRYLGAIGVDRERQGQGWGSLLLRRIVADATAAGTPVGLVTDRSRNVPYYERAGFALVARGTTADNRLAWWSFATPLS